jgi:TolB-like protein/Tfp pilus assembly protein PilF
VLPFTNLSADPENEYFSDGITEDILTNLSRIAGLRVISRTSVMQYKGASRSLRAIAEELGVAYVLEGSVRRDGEQVRITAQLIHAPTDRHLWAETYDREMRGIFAIQSEVAQRIASSLAAGITPEELARITREPTSSLTAYDHYLRGRSYYHFLRGPDNETAIAHFRRALALDPQYALAWAGLSDSYSQRVQFFGYPQEWLDSAMVAAQKAVALDADLAEAHKALGLAYVLKGWSGRSLEADRKAVALNPSLAPGLASLALHALHRGQLDEALLISRRIVAVEPTSPIGYLSLGRAYVQFGDHARAEEWLGKALERQPDHPLALGWMAIVRTRQGRLDEAADLAARRLTVQPRSYDALGLAGMVALIAGRDDAARKHLETALAERPNRPLPTLGYLLRKAGEREEAERLLSEFERFARDRMSAGDDFPVLRMELASVHAVRGNRAEALRWLREAESLGFVDHWFLSHGPLFASLRGDAEFRRIVVRLQARVEEMRRRVEREGW